MDVYAYAKRIRLCAKAGNMTGAMHLFDSMKQRGVRPNVISYNIMMDGFSKTGNPEAVHRLFHELVKSGVNPTHYTFNIAISACSIDIDLTRAAHLFSSMQKRYGLKPDAWTYGSLLHLCSVAGQLPLAKKCFDKMEKEAIKKTAVVYSCMIDAYAEATMQSNGRQHLNECLALVEKMKTEGIHPDHWTYAPLIKLCQRARLAKDGFELLGRMKEEGIVPDVYICTMLFDTLAKDDSILKEEAKCLMNSVLDEMEKKRIKFTSQTYSTVFALCRKLEDLKVADSFLGRLRASGLEPNSINYSSAIKCYQQIGDPSNKEAYLKTCFDLAEEMKATGLSLDVELYTTLIAACARVKDIDRAWDVWNEVKKKGIRGDIAVCGAMINAFLQSDELKRAQMFLKRMESAGSIRNSVICKMFMKHFEANQMKEEAKNFLREMKNLKIKQSEDVISIIKRLGLSSV